MKGKKTYLRLCIFMVMSLSIFFGAKTAQAMETISIKTVEDTDEAISLQGETSVHYVSDDEVKTYEKDGTTYTGDVIALNVPIDGTVIFAWIGGYGTVYNYKALFADANLTSMVYDLDKVNSSAYGYGYIASDCAFVELKKGTYYLFNGSSYNRVRNAGGTYSISAVCMNSGNVSLNQTGLYAFIGDTGCGKITLSKASNICLKTQYMADMRLLNSKKKELYDLTGTTFSDEVNVYLKPGTYYISFENGKNWGTTGHYYGYITYTTTELSQSALSQANACRVKRGVPVTFRYKATDTGYLTMTSPHNYATSVTQLDSSLTKKIDTGITNGCTNSTARFDVKKGKVYYFTITVNHIYCNADYPQIMLDYTFTKSTSANREKISTFSIPKTRYTYTKSAICPAVTVKNSARKTVSSDFYNITYSNNKNVGKAVIKVTCRGVYKGTVTKTFSIVPNKTAIAKLTAGSRKMKVQWEKNTVQTSGYQIQYAANSALKSAKTITVSGNTHTSKIITGLTKGKTYYVRVRCYKKISGVLYCSAWSVKKSVKVK